VVTKAMAKDPNERFRNAGEMIAAVEAAVAAAKPRAPVGGMRPPTRFKTSAVRRIPPYRRRR